MELFQDINNIGIKLDKDLIDIDSKIDEYKDMFDIFLKTFSIDVINFFSEKTQDIFNTEKLFYQTVSKLILETESKEIKTDFKLVNDIIKFKKNFFNKGNFFFYFLYFSQNIEATFFNMVVSKVKNYNELNLIKYEIDNKSFKELLINLSCILQSKFDKVDFLLKGGIKKKILVDKKYYKLIEKVNIFLDEKITEDKISDIFFLELKLSELHNNKKKNEIIQKTNNLETYFLDIQNIKKQIDKIETEIVFLKKNTITIDNNIKILKNSIKDDKSLKKVKKAKINFEISEQNIKINKKDSELKELEKNKVKELEYLNKNLSEFKLKKIELEDDSKIKSLNETISKTIDDDKLIQLNIELKKIEDNKYLDLLITNNQIDTISKKIDDLNGQNFKSINDEINELKNIREEKEKIKAYDNIAVVQGQINNLNNTKQDIEGKITKLSNKLKSLNTEYIKKNNNFNFKRVHFFKSNEALFLEFSKLDAIIKEFEEYLKILKINLYNFQNNSKIINDLLRSNLSNFCNNIEITISFNDYSDIVQECLKELKFFIKDILNFRYYEKLIFDLFNFTSYCDKNLSYITEQLINYNFYYSINNIKKLKNLDYNKKINLIVSKYEDECLNFDKDKLNEIINKKKKIISLKKKIKKFRDQLELIENLKCD